MERTVEGRLQEVRAGMARAASRFDSAPREVTLIAVSKGAEAAAVEAALEANQRDFGENRVQEAARKYPGLKARFPDLKLHLIGPLQSNKAREAVALFDVIHTVDREKIAAALSEEMRRAGKNLPVFIEVNIGGEAQKAGIAPGETAAFVKRCRQEHGLDVVGLMCIPPAGEAPGPYFAQTALLAREAGVDKLSMGMSGDFATAIEMGATHVRVGTAIFGERARP
jgi:pyridoxal phosphate enzyme (YggS family)